MSKEQPTPHIPQPIQIGVDPRIEVLTTLPGEQGQTIYKAARRLAEASAAMLDEAVQGLLAKYELPNDLAGLKEMGYEIMINIEPPRTDGQPPKREVVIFKLLEKVEVGHPTVKVI